MAHTTEVNSWNFTDSYSDNDDALEAMSVTSLREMQDEPGTIIIEVKSGVVTAVRGLPEGYQYEVLDHDVENEQ